MIEARKMFEVPLLDCEIEQIISFFNDDSASPLRPRLGIEIEFIERNNLDPAVLYGWIFDFISEFSKETINRELQNIENYSADFRCISFEYTRSVTLQIRDYLRHRINLPALTDEEKLHWDFLRFHLIESEDVLQQGPQFSPDELKEVDITYEDILAAANYVEENFPEIAAYDRAVCFLSEIQGYKGEREVGQASMGLTFISHALRRIRPLKAGERENFQARLDVRDIITSKRRG